MKVTIVVDTDGAPHEELVEWVEQLLAWIASEEERGSRCSIDIDGMAIRPERPKGSV